MKVKNLFETAEAESDTLSKTMEYLIYNELYATIRQEELDDLKQRLNQMEAEGDKTPATTYYHNLQLGSLSKQVRADVIKTKLNSLHISADGKTISPSKFLAFDVYVFDDRGHPPFKVVGDGLQTITIYKNCKKLKSIDECSSWLPQNTQLLAITGASLTSLAGIHKIIKSSQKIILNNLETRINSSILGLLHIKGLKEVDLVEPNAEVNRAFKIINKYLPEGDLLDCQEELIDSGLEEYAQL